MTTEAQSRCERYLPLAMSLAVELLDLCLGCDADNVKSDAQLGLVTASHHFDEEHHPHAFSSYARKWIVGAMLDGLRREEKFKLRRDELKDVGLALVASGGHGPHGEAAIKDEAEFVANNLADRRYGRATARRLSAIAISTDHGISLSAAAKRVRKARALIS